MFSLELPVTKRYNADVEQVKQFLEENGFERTGQALKGRFTYYENAGIGVTVMDGPAGTTVFPSGPLRGAKFGRHAVSMGKEPSFLRRVVEQEGSSAETGQGNRGSTGDVNYSV